MAGFLVFDTLQYVKKLKEAGVTEQAAEVQAEALKEIIENNLATKQDIHDLKRDIEMVNIELKRDIEMVNVHLKRDIEISKKDLTIRMGSMIIAAVSVLSILITFLNRFH